MVRKIYIISVFTFFFVGLCSLSFYYLYHSPSFGIAASWDKDKSQWRIDSVPALSPLKIGDVIRRIETLEVGRFSLMVDNYHVETRKELFEWFDEKRRLYEVLNQPSVDFLISRDGQILHKSIENKKAGFIFFGQPAFLQMVEAAIFFLIGSLVFAKKNSEHQSRVLYFICLGIATILATNSTSMMCEFVYYPAYFALMNILNLFSYFITAPLVFYFTFLIPHERKFLKDQKKMVLAFFGLNLVLAATLNIQIMDHLVAVYYGVSIASLLYAFFAYRGTVERQQMKWVLAGFLFGFGPWFFINGIAMLITGNGLMTDNIPMIFLVFMPLCIGFAIHRHRLFDIGLLFEGTLVFGLTIGILFVIDFAFTNLIITRFKDVQGAHLFSLLTVVLLYAPLRGWILAIVKKLFRRDQLNQGAIVESFSRLASGKSPEAVITIFKNLLKDIFRPKQIICLKRNDLAAYDILDILQKQRGFPARPFHLLEDNYALPLPYQDMAVAVPIGSKDAVHHILLMEPPAVNGKFYSRHDLAVLKALQSQAEVLYENSVLYDENVKECNLRLQQEKKYSSEKEHILRDLHDGIGGSITNINLLAELARKKCSDPKMSEKLSAIIDLSTESLSEIRGFLYSLEPKHTDWQALVADLRHFGSSLLEAHNIAFENRISVSDACESPDSLLSLVLFKIYREALNNILKHARATTVWLTLYVSKRLLSLTIEDNGIGKTEAGIMGRGISIMKTRAEEIGGRLDIRHSSGTRVTLELPLPLSYAAGEKQHAT